MIMNSRDTAILLNMVPEISPLTCAAIWEKWNDFSPLWSMNAEALRSLGFTPKALSAWTQIKSECTALLKQEMDEAVAQGIEILTLADCGYPNKLRKLTDPPLALYIHGDLTLLTKNALALVGTRKPTAYGERCANKFSASLAGLNIPTISGLARGIDSIVHVSTLRQQGQTIAVLGSGLLQLYPKENTNLARQISQSGLLISEFSLHSPPLLFHFPRRNRIIAGLALGVVVVEGDIKSGSLITAKLALEQGKEVFAVPGPIDSLLSRGPHQLIRQGAKLAESPVDILEEIPEFAPLVSSLNKEVSSVTEELAALSPPEQILLELIRTEPLHIDQLSARSHLNRNDFSCTLLNLELKGKVKALPGNLYIKV